MSNLETNEVFGLSELLVYGTCFSKYCTRD